MPLEWKESDRITIPGASARHKPIICASLSPNAHFLAVGYGNQLDVWDLRQAISSAPRSIIQSKSPRITTLAWSPDISRLVIGHDNGAVYAVSLNEKSAAIEGFTLQSSSPILSAAFLSRDVVVVATAKCAELHGFKERLGERSWALAGCLPDPPIFKDGQTQNAEIQSLHILAENQILIHYSGDGLVVAWSVILSPFACRLQSISKLPGRIDDICLQNGLVLLTDQSSGTYQVFRLDSQKPWRQFYPQLSRKSQPVSCAKLISKDVVVGGGVGQLVLWDIDTDVQLQNLTYRNQRDLVVKSISSAYRQDEDSGWIVTAHDFADRGEVIIWRTVDLQIANEHQLGAEYWSHRYPYYFLSVLVVTTVAFLLMLL